MKFVIDKEIVLNNQGDNKTDLLNTSVYADMLESTIKTADTNAPFTIGLFGEWGSGKSSVLKTTQEKLEKEADSAYKFVNYDAWKYAGDSFRRMFIYEVQQQLGVKPSDKLKLFYENINEDVEVKHKTNTHYWDIILCFAFFMVMLLAYKDILSDTFTFSLATVISAITLILNIKKHSTDDLKVTAQKSRMFAPEQFEECFNEIIEESRKEPTPIKRMLNWIKGVDVKSDKLVIVIDNIDRCNNEMAYSLLTDIKNFLGGKHKNLVFVIPVDVEALKKHIIRTNNHFDKDEQNQTADEFLRKFFNVSLWIKPFHTDEMFEYAESLNTKNDLGLSRETLSIMAREFATNPRRLIQLCNNLQIEFEAYKDIDFVSTHQPLICKLLILREEFPDYYRIVQKDATELFKAEDAEVAKSMRLNLFLKRTYYVSKPYEGKLSVIDRILSNSNTCSNITPNIKQLIVVPGSIEEICSFIGEDERKRSDVVVYILNQIRKAVDRKLMNSDMQTLYPSFLYMFKVGIIKDVECKQFVNLMSSSADYDQMLDRMSAEEEYLLMHVDFADKMIKLGSDLPVESYLRLIAENVKDEKPFIQSIRHSIFYACHLLGAEFVEQLATAFHKAYKEDPETVFAYTYQEAKTLFNVNLISEVIEAMTESNIKGNASPYMQFKMICSQIKPKKDDVHVVKWLEKIEPLIPSFSYTSNNKADMLPFFEYLEEFFGVNKDIVLTGEEKLKSIISKMTARTNAGGRNRSYLNDNRTDAHLINNFFSLFEITSLITGKPIVDYHAIVDLITDADWTRKTITQLDVLLNRGFDVSHYREAVVAVKEYNEPHLRLVEYMMSDNCPVERRLDSTAIRAELASLLDEMQKRNLELGDFIVKISTMERVREQLLAYLQNKPISFLESLDPKIQKFVVGKFEEQIDDYENNESILSLIAVHGSKSGIAKLVKILSVKINNWDTNVSPFSIMDKIRLLNQREFNLLSSSIENISDSNMSEEDKKGCIDTIKSKLSK